MSERKFITLNSDRICTLLDTAIERVIIAAPGFTDKVSARLINCSDRIGKKNVYVIIDDDPEAIRLGYGSFETFNTIFLNKVTIKKQTGIRIGLLIVDDMCFVYNPTPQIIEEEPKKLNIPNAIRLCSNERDEILEKLFPSDSSIDYQTGAEIGVAELSENEIKKIKSDLDKRPPVKPELERKIRVISSQFQFVEIELTGARLKNHSFSLKGKDLGIKNDTIAKRVTARYKLFDDEQIKKITKKFDLEEKLNKIKKHFLLNIPKYGNIIHIDKRVEFDKTIEKFIKTIDDEKEKIREELSNSLQKSREKIDPWIKQNLKRLKKQELKDILFPNSIEQIDAFVNKYLENKFPTVDNILTNISCFLKITNVSGQLIESKEFRESIEKVFNKNFDDIVQIDSAVKAKEEDI